VGCRPRSGSCSPQTRSATAGTFAGYELLIQLVFGQDTGGQIAGLVAGLMLQDYGRDNELEADRLGLEFTKAAGYDPTASLAVLDKFAQIQGKDPNRLELLFMTHPATPHAAMRSNHTCASEAGAENTTDPRRDAAYADFLDVPAADNSHGGPADGCLCLNHLR